jgi:glucose/mannose transport system permease protein
MGLYGSVWGLVLVHTVFGMPILTLLFRNYFSSILPEELFKAARVDGAGFWGIYFRIMLPMSPADLRGGADPAGDGDLERLPVRRGLHPSRPSYPMTVQLNNIVNSVQGREGIQRQHGRHAAHRAWCRSFDVLRRRGKLFVRGIAAGAVKAHA